MIVATGMDTGLPAYIFVDDIKKIESIKSGPCSFTRVFMKNIKENHDYFLDVNETRDEINKKIKEDRHIPGRGVEQNGQE